MRPLGPIVVVLFKLAELDAMMSEKHTLSLPVVGSKPSGHWRFSVAVDGLFKIKQNQDEGKKMKLIIVALK